MGVTSFALDQSKGYTESTVVYVEERGRGGSEERHLAALGE